MPRILPAALGALFLSLVALVPAQAGMSPDTGSPACGKFFDRWDVDGAPAGILAMGGFGREVMAAQDCLNRGDVATACTHWKGLLPVIDRIGAPLDAQRGGIENLIRTHGC